MISSLPSLKNRREFFGFLSAGDRSAAVGVHLGEALNTGTASFFWLALMTNGNLASMMNGKLFDQRAYYPVFLFDPFLLQTTGRFSLLFSSIKVTPKSSEAKRRGLS